MTRMNASDPRYIVPALMRGLELLTQFNKDRRVISGAEMNRLLNLPRASVFRMIQTLEIFGFLERVPGTGAAPCYRLGVGVLRLGFEYLAAMEINEHGYPVIEALRDATGHSAHLVVRDLREVVFVAKAAGRSPMFNTVQVGARLPAHATVLGRVLLSALSVADVAALYGDEVLPAFTAKTPTSAAALSKAIAQDMVRGFGISQGGYEPGICTLAAPVFNDKREVVAAISITVPAQKIAPEAADALGVQLLEAAALLTQRITHL
jgi:DNA-binding IclR family transcriptional regulator